MSQARKAKAQPAPQPEDHTVRVKIQGKPYEIDLDDLTWGEVEEVEIHFGCSIDDVDWETGRGVMFLAYLARHRVDATFLLGDMQSMRAKDVEIDDSPRPTDSGDADTGTPS